MGGVFTCVTKVPDIPRENYDMTPIRTNPFPVIWITGAPGSGRTTQAELLSRNLNFENVIVANLINDEANNETERGKIIKDCFKHSGKRVPDEIVIDLLKEEMLKKIHNTKGFILNGFPRTSKQASLFVKEIVDVDVILYLYTDVDVLLQRSLSKGDITGKPELIKKDILNYTKEVKESVSKFGSKVEKIQVSAPLGDVYAKIEEVLKTRFENKLALDISGDDNEVVQMTEEL